MTKLSVKSDGVEHLSEAMGRFGAGAGQVIQEVYEEFAAKEIKENVLPLVHSSGRVFKGHRQGAKSAGTDKVFRHSVNGLDLIVRTNAKFGYLYFPDDGSNTKRHAGNQHFMQRGLDQSVDSIVERCVARLTEEF